MKALIVRRELAEVCVCVCPHRVLPEAEPGDPVVVAGEDREERADSKTLARLES